MENRNQNQHKEERKPIITLEACFLYSKGLYDFFCNNIAKIAIVIFSILNNVKEFTQKLKTEEYRTLVNGIWIVNHMANKLEGISSVSSSVWDNALCKLRQTIENCICKFCYAFNQQSYQTGLREHNILNGLILRNVLIPVKFFKFLRILFPYLRIESFGDTANVIQARNYIRIIKAFPEKRCAIWSKNIGIWNQAFKLEGKPKNTTYVHSSLKLNCPDDVSKYDFVDHVFTVYTKAYAKKHNIVINCGGKKCLECILAKINCYYRNTAYHINELKK